MSSTSVEAKVRQLVAEKLAIDEDQVRPESSFMEDLGADSLDTVELVMAFEEEFQIEIPDDAAEKIATVRDVLAYIEAHTNPTA